MTGKEKEKIEAEVWYQGHEPCMKGAYEETDLAGIFPAKISSALVDGMEDFNKKIRGFSHPLSILSGVESRTSSPVRIVRDNHSLESVIGDFILAERAQDMPAGLRRRQQTVLKSQRKFDKNMHRFIENSCVKKK